MKYFFATLSLIVTLTLAGIFSNAPNTFAASCDCVCGKNAEALGCSTSPQACDAECVERGSPAGTNTCLADPSCDTVQSFGVCTCSDKPTESVCTTSQECQAGFQPGGQFLANCSTGKFVKKLNDDPQCTKIQAQFGQCQCGASVSCKTLAECLSSCPTSVDFKTDDSCLQTTAGPNFIDNSKPAKSGEAILRESNPINATDVRGALGRVINIFTGVSGTIALLMFVYGGILYVFSAGDETRVKQAQGVFKWSTLGLVLIFTSYAVVNQVFTVLNNQFSAQGIKYPDIYPLGNISPGILVGKIIQYILSVMGVAALLVMIWGGFQYFLSFGDPKKAESGRKTLVYAVIGLIIIFSSYAAASFLINTLSRTGTTGGTQQQVAPPVFSEDAGQIATPEPLCAACDCVSQDGTRLSLGPTTEEECNRLCQPTTGISTSSQGTVQADCRSSVSETDQTPVDVACEFCTCIILEPPPPGQGTSSGVISERPLGFSSGSNSCRTQCQENFPDTFVRSQCD